MEFGPQHTVNDDNNNNTECMLQDLDDNFCALPSVLASIPGRVFAFITVRRTTGPGTSCLRMRQIFIVYLWSAKIFNKSIIEICTQKMHRVSTQKMHIGSCFTKAWGVASCAAAQLQ